MLKINKFNEKVIGLKKNKLFKKGVALALGATMISSFTGCGEAKAPLEGTLLEGTIVAEVDGKPQILSKQIPTDCFNSADLKINSDHDHYRNIITNEYLTTCDDCEEINFSSFFSPKYFCVRYVENIDVKGSINDFLTVEELKKAMIDTLSDDDILTIVNRIKNMSTEEKSNQKVK